MAMYCVLVEDKFPKALPEEDMFDLFDNIIGQTNFLRVISVDEVK